MIGRSVWRSRVRLFLLLGVLLVGNAAILISYNVLYEARFHSLQDEKRRLETQRDEAKGRLDSVNRTEQRLRKLGEDLETFHTEVLGKPRERLAPLIEGIRAATRKAGFQPESISYSEEEVSGATRFSLLFNIEGRYAEIKNLLAAFESDPRFLVLENVTVAADDKEPDLLKATLRVSHYFRKEGGPAPRRTSARSAAGRQATSPRGASAPGRSAP